MVKFNHIRGVKIPRCSDDRRCGSLFYVKFISSYEFNVANIMTFFNFAWFFTSILVYSGKRVF